MINNEAAVAVAVAMPPENGQSLYRRLWLY